MDSSIFETIEQFSLRSVWQLDLVILIGDKFQNFLLMSITYFETPLLSAQWTIGNFSIGSFWTMVVGSAWARIPTLVKIVIAWFKYERILLTRTILYINRTTHCTKKQTLATIHHFFKVSFKADILSDTRNPWGKWANKGPGKPHKIGVSWQKTAR